MTITINTDDDRDTMASKVGATLGRERLRTSSARERRLEQASQRRTRVWDLRLSIVDDHPTAYCDQNGDVPEIGVTSREIDQPVTDLDPKDWDYAAQRAFAWHEDGHVLFTDHDDFMDRLQNVEKGDKGTAKQIWNALEDGAIETSLAGSWNNAHEVLKALRANIFEQTDSSGNRTNAPGIQDVEKGGRVFPLAHATHGVILDEWMLNVYGIHRNIKPKLADADDPEYHFPTEEAREIFLDEILPLIEDVVPDVLSEPDAVARNQRIFEFIHEVLPLITEAQPGDGKSQMNRDEQQTPDGMPEDATEGHSGEARADADLADVDPDDIEKVVISDIDPDADPEAVEIPEGVEVEISENVEIETREEAGIGDDLLDELEELTEALNAAGEKLADDKILLPSEDWEADQIVYEQARQAAQPIAQILRNRLQQERTSEVKRQQRRGRFTGRGGALARATRGEKEVKERTEEPEEKEYHFVFVLDRSGSMRSCMKQAEVALGMLALALEEVGVEVMIVELYSDEARLAKPFGVSMEQRLPEVFHGNYGGGTPLSGAVELARERLNRSNAENKALVAVTDGDPANDDKFERAIRNCSMPTLGVNLTNSDSPTGMDDYDRAVAASPGEDLGTALKQLVQEVMF